MWNKKKQLKLLKRVFSACFWSSERVGKLFRWVLIDDDMIKQQVIIRWDEIEERRGEERSRV
jgi:hypothetical protein